MNRRMKYLTYTGFFLSIFFAMGFIFMHSKELGPLNIKVVDAVTGKPLEGILVYRILESYYVKSRVLLIIPSPKPQVIRKIELGEKYITDENGMVQIDKQSIKLRKKENIYYERLTLNLELDMETVPDFIKKSRDFPTKFHIYNYYMIGYLASTDNIFRPDPKYRGANILSSEDYLWPEGFVDKSDYSEYVDFYWYEVKWDEQEERTITVRLKPYCPEEAAKAKERREEWRRKRRSSDPRFEITH